MENVIMEKPMTCLYNPEVGYENVYDPSRKAARGKKVLVVGGGPAGMEAAYISAMRGHHVRLLEKGPQLGGSAGVASVVEAKKEFAGVTEFLENQVRKWNVDVRLNEEVHSDVLKEGEFDEIIMATGSTPNVPKLNMCDSGSDVRFAKDVLKDSKGVGKEVIILGGGSIGMETAECLELMGKNVTVIEMLDRICSDLGPLNRADVLDRIEKTSIKIMVKTKVLELTEKGIRVSKEGEEETIPCPDTVVIAMGAKPNTVRLEGIKANIHYVGDCQKVGNAMDAIRDAFHIALKL
jgi:pyruvate/2-oxoglutarate dehydrogenase complex dihydrolipoamide dehydrogenase (E3) component